MPETPVAANDNTPVADDASTPTDNTQLVEAPAEEERTEPISPEPAPEPDLEPKLEAANDTGISEPLPATGTE